jgi:hypothetical protein
MRSRYSPEQDTEERPFRALPPTHDVLLRRVGVLLRYEEAQLLHCTLRFTCKSQQNGEPTSGLEPLTPAHYE